MLGRTICEELSDFEVVPTDLPEAYVRNLVDVLHRHLGCAVRLMSGVKHANGKHTKGVLEIDFQSNDDLDRVLNLMGVTLD